MTLRSLWTALLLAVAVMLSLGAAPALARDLAIATLDGAEFDRLDGVLVRGFAVVAGAPVQATRWPGGLALLHAHTGDATDAWDVVLLSGAELAPACDQALLEKLDWGRLGGRDHYVAPAVSDCGVGAEARSTVLAWDRDKLAIAPTWADFWDVVKNPGKRGLRRGVRGNLEIALLADGVAPADVYRLLRGSDGVDRAFRKLDQLKPYIDWWQSEAQASRILGSGEVLMTSAPSAGIAAANRAEHRNLGIQWVGSLLAVDWWAIVKGSPNIDAAYRFLVYAEDARQQARLADAAYGWLEKGATDGQPAEVVAVSPTAADHLSAALPTDEAFWRDNADKLTDRFNAWLATH